jgi:RecJ-like exonuclease
MSEPRIVCSACHGDGADVEDGTKDCRFCGGIGSLLACAGCGQEPIDPLRAPFCSCACEEECATKAKLDAIREARRGRGP